MTDIFMTVLNMSVTAAFVIAVLCLARLVLRKLCAPKWISYALWSVTGFNLVSPFKLEGAFSLIPFNSTPIPMDIAMQEIPHIDSGISIIDSALSASLPAAIPAASANPLQIWTAVGAYVWLFGVAVMLLYAIISYVRLLRRKDNLETPFVYGFIKPKIHIPSGLTGEELRYATLHEQTHIKRHDHLIKLFAFALLCVHWFNPFAWLAFILFCADMEMSCDERILRELGIDAKADYSQTLLSLSMNRRILAASPLAFGEGGVKERVKNVLNFKKQSRVTVVAAVALAAALTAGFAVNRAEHSLSLPIFVDGEAVPPPSAPEGVIDLVENFGLQLQKVQLVAPDEIAIQDISEQYPDFVTDELLRKWMDNPETAPGRVGSSPWPDRIDISSAEKLRDTEYEVSGALVWITSTEIANGGAARIQPIKLTVTKNGTEWKISSVSVDAYSYTTASAPATADPPAAATDSVADSAVVIDNGTGQVSADGGQTWMDEEANQKLHPMLDIVWWTYDEYKEWLEEQKKILPGMIGGIRGYYDEKDVLHQDVWTQEKVDEAISLYEQTLDDIGNGAKVSKYIDGYVDDGGEKIGLTIIAIHPDSISASYTAGISLRDGGTVNLGPFATAEERLAAVEAFCEEQVKAGKMTRQEADKILSEYR